MQENEGDTPLAHCHLSLHARRHGYCTIELESTEQSLHQQFFPRAIGMFHQDLGVGIVVGTV